MSVVKLSSVLDDFEIHVSYWFELLKLATMFGWEPEGTRATAETRVNFTRHRKWNGNYYQISYQIVVEEDALNLAKAIKKALRKIPKERTGLPDYLRNHLDYFSGKEMRDLLRNLSKFFDEGSFIIG
jgi:hypothetical protein